MTLNIQLDLKSDEITTISFQNEIKKIVTDNTFHMKRLLSQYLHITDSLLEIIEIRHTNEGCKVDFNVLLDYANDTSPEETINEDKTNRLEKHFLNRLKSDNFYKSFKSEYNMKYKPRHIELSVETGLQETRIRRNSTGIVKKKSLLDDIFNTIEFANFSPTVQNGISIDIINESTTGGYSMNGHNRLISAPEPINTDDNIIQEGEDDEKNNVYKGESDFEYENNNQNNNSVESDSVDSIDGLETIVIGKLNKDKSV